MKTPSNPKPERLVAGVMSGTSLDGVDAVIVRLTGSGQKVTYEVLGHGSSPYDAQTRRRLLASSEATGSSVREITILHSLLPKTFAAAVREAASNAGLDVKRLDAIGCHGQTIHHVPPVGTLQIGSLPHLAAHLDVTVVGDFRSADMALGGQGAPLAPYFDYALFSNRNEGRIMLNLGGIANITILPPNCGRSDVIAFDTGPANMVIDALAQRLLNQPMDVDGKAAGRSEPNVEIVATLLEDPYFASDPPKSTGREAFGSAYVDDLVSRLESALGPEGSWTEADRNAALATATELTVESVGLAVDWARQKSTVDRVIVSGGGTYNRTILDSLTRRVAPSELDTIADHGIDPSHKEAICFALLAHEFLNGFPTGMPSVTGARSAALQGVLCVPILPNPESE